MSAASSFPALSANYRGALGRRAARLPGPFACATLCARITTLGVCSRVGKGAWVRRPLLWLVLAGGAVAMAFVMVLFIAVAADQDARADDGLSGVMCASPGPPGGGGGGVRGPAAD